HRRRRRFGIDSAARISRKIFTVCPHAARWLALQCFIRGLFVRPSRSTAGGRGMGDNTEMGTLAVTEELHAKQQEPARKEAERAARKAPQNAAADAKGEAGEPASKKGSAARSSRPPGRPAIGGRACRAQAGRPGGGTRWDTGTRRRRPGAQAGATAENRP